jgi:DNA-binding beta-propeller fold protein YncE
MKLKRRSVLLSVACAATFVGLTITAQAAEWHLVKTIQVPGHPIKVVDFSTLNQENGLMYVTDRSNSGVDVFDTNNDTFVRRYGGFRGVVEKPERSGPNIALFNGDVLWVTDAPSNIKVLASGSGRILDTFDCEGGDARIDGAALDPKDHIVMGESADSTLPYLCWIDGKGMKITEKQKWMREATNGLEGSQWDARTNVFYLALPEVTHGPGAVYVINPTTHAVVKSYPLPDGDRCEPAGISLNTEQDEILVGCDTKDYTDIISLKDGHVDQTGILGGTDQTAYDPGTHMYFLGARRSSKGPVLGVIDSHTHKLVASPETSAGTHAVAVNYRTHKVYLPMAPNTKPFDNDVAKGLSCTHGCIGVYEQ